MASDQSFRNRVPGTIAGLAIVLAACSGGGQVPTATAPTVTPSPSVVVSAAADPIPSGTYVSQTIPVADVIALIKADTTLGAAQQATSLQEFNGHQTDIVTLDFQHGLFTESDAIDGGEKTVGAQASYAFPDSHTLVIQEQCCGLSTFTITSQPGGFSLKYKVGAPNAGEDVVGQWLYETSPFTLVP